MKKNDVVTLEINDINNLGYGVGRYEDKVVFVSGGVTLDKLKVKIIKVNKSWCIGKTEQIISASPYRLKEKFCTAPDSCGGCAYRNVIYDHEIECKREYVVNAFRKCGIYDAKIGRVQTAGDIKRYRNKAQYPVKNVNGKMKAGFYGAKTHNIVPIEDCSLASVEFSLIVDFICNFCDEHNISAYDEISQKGTLRHIYLRQGYKTGEIMVCLVIRDKVFALKDEFSKEIQKKFSNVKSVMLNYNLENTNVILGEKFECIGGHDYIEDELCSVKFRISAGSFYQVNRDGAELLYNLAADYTIPEGKTVLDLYCGTGTIGLSMARHAKRVIGIEIVEEAVKCAKINAEINGLQNAEFYCGDASCTEGLLESVEAKTGLKINPDVVIMDPPRKGSTKELIHYLAKRDIKKIVYVSCDPVTLARDCAEFLQLGYEMSEVKLVNMFPRTGHIESVVSLEKNK